jgi:hypothetical protein
MHAEESFPTGRRWMKGKKRIRKSLPLGMNRDSREPKRRRAAQGVGDTRVIFGRFAVNPCHRTERWCLFNR